MGSKSLSKSAPAQKPSVRAQPKPQADDGTVPWDMALGAGAVGALFGITIYAGVQWILRAASGPATPRPRAAGDTVSMNVFRLHQTESDEGDVRVAQNVTLIRPGTAPNLWFVRIQNGDEGFVNVPPAA